MTPGLAIVSRVFGDGDATIPGLGPTAVVLTVAIVWFVADFSGTSAVTTSVSHSLCYIDKQGTSKGDLE